MVQDVLTVITLTVVMAIGYFFAKPRCKRVLRIAISLSLVLPLLHLAKIPLDDSLFLFFWPSSIGFMALGAGPNPSGVIISIWLTLITANMFTYFIVTLLGYYLYKLVGKK